MTKLNASWSRPVGREEIAQGYYRFDLSEARQEDVKELVNHLWSSVRRYAKEPLPTPIEADGKQ